jgi:hypothetical protein
MDFVTILREEANDLHSVSRITPAHRSIMRSAANEIEKLNRQVDELRAEVQYLSRIAKY